MYTFNSIEWIREALPETRGGVEVSFNSIEWIQLCLYPKLSCPLATHFQFHWMDS